MTSSTNRCFAKLWGRLSRPSIDVWRSHRAGTKGTERQREALELLASILWHLETAASIAELPRQTMDAYYEELVKAPDALTPWRRWIEQQTGVRSEAYNDQLLINYT